MFKGSRQWSGGLFLSAYARVFSVGSSAIAHVFTALRGGGQFGRLKVLLPPLISQIGRLLRTENRKTDATARFSAESEIKIKVEICRQKKNTEWG